MGYTSGNLLHRYWSFLPKQESIFFEGTFAGFPFPRLRAEALWRASTGMTQIEYGLEFHF
jgi:hypothetical protein